MNATLKQSNDEAFASLREQYPWPQERPLPEESAFLWSLDGGGRHLMNTLFAQRQIYTMVEGGSFMGGSAIQWLTANPTLKLICVDPWPNALAGYVRNLLNVGWALKLYKPEDLARYADLLDKHGTLAVVQNNLWDFRDRVIMARGTMQEIYPVLAKAITPDVLYTDALKVFEEFELAHTLFPDTILTGDDWTWSNADGAFPVRVYASKIAAKRGAKIYADYQTFIIKEPDLAVEFDEKYLYRPELDTLKKPVE